MGKADCNECGGKGTKVLIIDQRGIWSKCKRCGFMEWEWQTGDNIDYLNYLTKRYGITTEQLLSAISKIAEKLY
jgi:hypothetical protein